MHTTLLLLLLSGASEPSAPIPAAAPAPAEESIPAAAPGPPEESATDTAPGPAPAPGPPEESTTAAAPAPAEESVPSAAPAPPEASTPVAAAKPRTGHAHGFNGGAYLTVSGMTSVSLESGHHDRIGGSFRTASGYLWALPSQVKLYVGGGFQHRVLKQGEQYGVSRETGVFAMARVGRGTNNLWGYGLFGVGAEIRVDSPPPSDPSPFVDPYFVVSVEAGGGVAARLWRGFFVGGELTFETGTDFYGGVADELSFFNARVVTGWAF